MEHVHKVTQTRRGIHRGNIHMKEQPNKEKYTEGAPHGGDMHTKGIFTRRGHTQGETYTQRGTTQRHTWRVYTYGREVHMNGHT